MMDAVSMRTASCKRLLLKPAGLRACQSSVHNDQLFNDRHDAESHLADSRAVPVHIKTHDMIDQQGQQDKMKEPPYS